jgi:hypothetical protein
MVGIGVSEAIGEVLAVIERQDLIRESRRCRSVPDRDITSWTRAGFGAAQKGLIVSKSGGKKRRGRSPSDRKLGTSHSDRSAFQPQAPCVGDFSPKQWTHTHTLSNTYRSQNSRRERYCLGDRDSRRASMPQDWDAGDRHVGPAVEGWRRGFLGYLVVQST